jgi:hypothetical protein
MKILSFITAESNPVAIKVVPFPLKMAIFFLPNFVAKWMFCLCLWECDAFPMNLHSKCTFLSHDGCLLWLLWAPCQSSEWMMCSRLTHAHWSILFTLEPPVREMNCQEPSSQLALSYSEMQWSRVGFTSSSGDSSIWSRKDIEHSKSLRKEMKWLNLSVGIITMNWVPVIFFAKRTQWKNAIHKSFNKLSLSTLYSLLSILSLSLSLSFSLSLFLSLSLSLSLIWWRFSQRFGHRQFFHFSSFSLASIELRKFKELLLFWSPFIIEWSANDRNIKWQRIGVQQRLETPFSFLLLLLKGRRPFPRRLFYFILIGNLLNAVTIQRLR